MLTSRTTFSLASVICALALATAGALAPSSDARAVKAAAPSLTIQAKTCLIGATPEDRSVTATALALLGPTGERVTMRFTVQSRQGQTRWRSLLFKDPTTTKKWETTEAAGAGLKLTKTIPELEEGFDYRVVIEARSVDAAGKVVTKTARKYVPCKQPLFTPTLVLNKVLVVKKAPPEYDAVLAGGAGVEVTVKNLGRLPSAGFVVTLAKADTLETLTTLTGEPLKGGGSSTLGWYPAGGCNGSIYVTVQEKDAAPAMLTPTQAATVKCPDAGTTASKSGRR